MQSRSKKIIGGIIILIIFIAIPFIAYFLSVPIYSLLFTKRGLIVETRWGKVRGIISVSRDGREFYEWLGIPYAKPPVGDLRFASPQRFDTKWDQVLDASAYGSPCLQVDVVKRNVKGHEDCLFLNIHAPKLKDPPKLLPVLFFIHGGSFICGSADDHKPHYFMDENVILITINYRLGPLGFLNLGNDNTMIRGNMGLKDQSLALKWVNENILSFGGDPKQITIFGESAGSASIHYHLLSQRSRGLMRRAISQSGSALNFWALKDNPSRQAMDFAEQLNCDISLPSSIIVECLKKVDIHFFMEVQRLYFTFTREKNAIFAPTVESALDEDTFLPDHPKNLIKSGKFAKIPWLTGFNADEGLLFMLSVTHAPDYRQRVETDWSLMTDTLLYLSDIEKQNNNGDKIREFYFGLKEHINLDLITQFDSASNLLADRNFNYGMYKAAIAHAENNASVQFYFYNKIGPSPFGNLFFNQNFNGVCHGDELAMLFESFGILKIHKGAAHYEFSKDLVKTWVDFASLSNIEDTEFRGQKFPLLNQLSELSNNRSSFQVLEINDEPKVRDFPGEERMQFWTSIDR